MKHKRKEKSTTRKELEPKTSELEELRCRTENLQKEKDELLGKLQRVSADYANFQKRVPRQIADTISYEKERLIKTLLPVLDNFELTLQNANEVENVDVLIKGIQIIYDQMLNILKSHGVEPIRARAEQFDPSIHEATMQQARPEMEENIVLEEFQTGYKLNGRAIRPSKVMVNKLSSQESAEQRGKDEEQQAQDGPDNLQE